MWEERTWTFRVRRNCTRKTAAPSMRKTRRQASVLLFSNIWSAVAALAMTSSLTDMEIKWMSMSTPPSATNLRCSIGVAHRSNASCENCLPHTHTHTDTPAYTYTKVVRWHGMNLREQPRSHQRSVSATDACLVWKNEQHAAPLHHCTASSF